MNKSQNKQKFFKPRPADISRRIWKNRHSGSVLLTFKYIFLLKLSHASTFWPSDQFLYTELCHLCISSLLLVSFTFVELSLDCRSRGGRAVTCLAFQSEDPGSMAGAGSQNHSYLYCIHVFVYPSYSSSSDGWGRKMAISCIGALLRARKRTRVAVVELCGWNDR